MARSTSYYRVGRYIRFNKSDVLKWLEDQQTDW
jgi:excisionase family DNA binding protein